MLLTLHLTTSRDEMEQNQVQLQTEFNNLVSCNHMHPLQKDPPGKERDGTHQEE